MDVNIKHVSNEGQRKEKTKWTKDRIEINQNSLNDCINYEKAKLEKWDQKRK